MGVWQIILGIVLILFSVAIIVVVLLQEGHQAGLGAITGGADTFLAKNQARTVDAVPCPVDKGDCRWLLYPCHRSECACVLCPVNQDAKSPACISGAFFCQESKRESNKLHRDWEEFLLRSATRWAQ